MFFCCCFVHFLVIEQHKMLATWVKQRQLSGSSVPETDEYGSGSFNNVIAIMGRDCDVPVQGEISTNFGHNFFRG